MRSQSCKELLTRYIILESGIHWKVMSADTIQYNTIQLYCQPQWLKIVFDHTIDLKHT